MSNRKPVQIQKPEEQNVFKSGRSPTRQAGTNVRIAKRQLWWKEPPSNKQIPASKPFKVAEQTCKIDHKNLGFQPSGFNNAKIDTQKLEWNGKSVVDTWSNVKHQPGGINTRISNFKFSLILILILFLKGGNKEIVDDRVNYNALPKVDCGFNYEFE